MTQAGEPRRQIYQLSDQLLTLLTVLLSILLFIVAPMQANGVMPGTVFGVIFAAVLMPAAFMVAANWYAVGAIVVAIAMMLEAAALESQQPTVADAYLDSLAWLIAGVTLSAVIARLFLVRAK